MSVCGTALAMVKKKKKNSASPGYPNKASILIIVQLPLLITDFIKIKTKVNQTATKTFMELIYLTLIIYKNIPLCKCCLRQQLKVSQKILQNFF